MLKIAFIGGGNMATALIGGLVGKLSAGKDVHVVDINPSTLKTLQTQFGVTTATEIDNTVAQCDVIVLAIKPQQMKEVLEHLQTYVSGQLILSIAAGVRISDISRWLNGHRVIVRAMPNTPALIGKGMAGLVAASEVSAAQREMANAILCAVGATLWVEQEEQIDAVTAISGSGPAYVFYFLEAMQQAAQELGLSAEQGLQLAQSTFAGATELAVQSSESVAVLRDRVTSKGGTTYASLMSMEQNDVKAGIVKAIHACAARARELGEELGKA